MSSRSFLLLQGVASPFFSELGKALKHSGHDVLKINFCGGDLLSGRFFLRFLKQINYKGSLEALDDFYDDVFTHSGISDIILFGDTRPIHLPAIKLARKRNIKIHVYEEGYLRPNWVTLDKSGVNAYSSLPRDTQSYLDFIKHHPDISTTPPQKTGGSLATRAWHDIRYQLTTFFLKPLFPNYQTHRPDSAFQEYMGWIRRMPALWFYYNKQAQKAVKAIISTNKIFYIVPLQLDADAQIRLHSPIKSVSEFIQRNITSFAKFAPEDTFLVIKIHPLDPWFVNFCEVIEKTAKQNNISTQRIIYLESGDLPLLLEHAKGTIVINSTVGTLSLAKNCPVIALGSAIYNLPGLTFQGSLDEFWTQASPPDKTLFEAFRTMLIQQTQINGSFYNQKGIKLAVEGSLPFLTKPDRQG